MVVSGLCGLPVVWLGWATVVLSLGMAGWGLVRSRQRGSRSMAAAMVLVAAHPGIWLEPSPVDCGVNMLGKAVVFTILVGLGAAWGATRPPDPPVADPPLREPAPPDPTDTAGR